MQGVWHCKKLIPVQHGRKKASKITFLLRSFTMEFGSKGHYVYRCDVRGCMDENGEAKQSVTIYQLDQ